MGRLLPVLLALAGLAGGLGLGHALKPAPAPDPEAEADTAEAPAKPAAKPAGPDTHWEYAKLDGQFVVPVIGEGRVAALVVLSISLEVAPGTGTAVFAREPKLRDALLSVLFAHERAGGFSGTFTDARVMGELRARLREAAIAAAGEDVNDVLVTDILRQEL